LLLPSQLALTELISVLSAPIYLSTAASAITFKDIQLYQQLEVKSCWHNQVGATRLGFDMAENVPGDAIARLYGVSPQIKIGTFQPKVSGTLTNLQTIVNWQAPQATYPARGKVIIAGTNNFLFRDRSECGRWNCPQLGNWLIAGSIRQRCRCGVWHKFRQRYRHPNGTFKLSGTTESFKPETIRATGSGRVNIAGGTVTASNIQLAGGRWQGQGLQLASSWADITAATSQLQDASTVGSTCPVVWLRLHRNNTGQWQRQPAADGTVTATNVTLRDGRWQGLCCR